MLGVEKRSKANDVDKNADSSAAAGINVGLLFAEFLAPLFHHAVFLKEIYPAKYFQQCTAYEVPLFRCFHPLVRDYIARACDSCPKWIDGGKLERASVVFFDEFGDKTVSLSVRFSQGRVTATTDDALYLKNFFRESLLLLERKLAGGPRSSTFQIEIVAAGNLTDNRDWVLVEREENSIARVVPLKSLGSIPCVGSEIFIKSF